MKIYRRILIVIFSVGIVHFLAACENSSEESITTLDNDLLSKNSLKNTEDDSINLALKEDASNNETIKDKDVSINTAANLKEEYLKKLNETKIEIEKLEAEDSSTYALKKVENDRYDTWDELLNEIYGVLKKHFTTEEMDLLRKEQRNWITYRDETAKEASLKFQGGTMEHLEYVAVLASLTEERCYDLVEDYMNVSSFE